MSETLLKQEFREKDVQRMRNIMTKKYGDSTTKQTGYEKKEEEHKEGDIWEHNDKMWTIKNGLKQSYTKLDSIKATIRMPLSCPKCSNRMRGKLDTKMYSIHTMCATCVAKMESKLKLSGNYQEYINTFVTGNMITHLDDAEQFIMEYAQSRNAGYVTEDGDIEDVMGSENKDEIIDKWKKEIQEMREKLINNTESHA
jgi:hypothetical protein